MIESNIEWSIRNRYIVCLALAVAGVLAMLTMPLDAIPNLSENQVSDFADWMGRSPKEIEDKVTYPLASKLQGLAGVKVVRSSSEFNFSMITIIFDDKTDYDFARERVLENLATIVPEMPPGVLPYMAPATIMPGMNMNGNAAPAVAPAPAAPAPAPATPAAAARYHCPHHPGVVASFPAKCPYCGMALTK